MLQAMNTGHEGSLSTVHANSPRDALNRLETMVLMAGYELPLRAIRSHVSSALDLVIQLDRLDDGSRRVVEISEVQRMEGEVITLQKLFEFKIEHFDSERRIVGRLHPTGLRPGFPRQVRAPRDRAAAEPVRRSRERRLRRERAGAAGSGQRERPMRLSAHCSPPLVGDAGPVRRSGRRRAGASVGGAAGTRHAPAVPGARLRRSAFRKRPTSTRAGRRGAGERPPGHRCARRPAREQRAALRRRARARREREHDRRAGGRGARRPLARSSRIGAEAEEVGIVAFNGEISVLRDSDAGRRRAATGAGRAAAHRLRNAHQRRAHAVARRSCARRSSRPARSSCSRTVQDVGSVLSLDEVIAAAKAQQVRVFTVGLRSRRLRRRARCGRSRIGPVGRTPRLVRRRSSRRSTRRSATQLAGEYLVRYRSVARPKSQVTVERSGRRASAAPPRAYVAPTPVAAASIPPLARLEVPALGQLAAADQPVLRAARLRAAAPARATAEDHRRRPCTDVRARDTSARVGQATAAGRGASRNAEPLRERLVGPARA